MPCSWNPPVAPGLVLFDFHKLPMEQRCGQFTEVTGAQLELASDSRDLHAATSGLLDGGEHLVNAPLKYRGTNLVLHPAQVRNGLFHKPASPEHVVECYGRIAAITRESEQAG